MKHFIRRGCRVVVITFFCLSLPSTHLNAAFSGKASLEEDFQQAKLSSSKQEKLAASLSFRSFLLLTQPFLKGTVSSEDANTQQTADENSKETSQGIFSKETSSEKEDMFRQRIPNNRIPKNPLPHNRIPRNSLENHRIPKNSIPKNPIPRNTLDHNTIPRNSIPRNPIPRNPLPHNKIPSGSDTIQTKIKQDQTDTKPDSSSNAHHSETNSSH